MKIYPAIDLMDGKVVRLKGGDFAQKTDYGLDPFQVAAEFRELGATHLHIVDLDGAKDGAARQTSLIQDLVAQSQLKVQTGGGVRSVDDVKRLLEVGVDKVIIGSLAVTKPEVFKAIAQEVRGESITLGLDVRLDDQGEAWVATHGWAETSQVKAETLLSLAKEVGVTQILCTDIAKDGMLQGPNHQLYERLAASHKSLGILASGGVSGIEDLAVLHKAGVSGVIIGKAYYEGRLDLKEALAYERL